MALRDDLAPRRAVRLGNGKGKLYNLPAGMRQRLPLPRLWFVCHDEQMEAINGIFSCHFH
jgi:hypothetical protein